MSKQELKTREDYVAKDGRVASWWQKDGAWHTTELHVPTKADRECFPKSYPAGDDGPFYRWTGDAFDTREEAIDSLTGDL